MDAAAVGPGSRVGGREGPPAWLVGAGAGMVTVVGFAALHQLLISDIWFSLVPMLVAGALCGACLAWNYDLLFEAPSPATWAAFVGLHLLALMALGMASVLLFDPVVPMAVVVAANEPPTELMRRALPLTAGFALGTAALASLLWGRTPAKVGANLLASIVLLVLLGLNVSVLGLVELSREALGVVAEFLGLTALILVGYGMAVAWAARRRFVPGGAAPRPAPPSDDPPAVRGRP